MLVKGGPGSRIREGAGAPREFDPPGWFGVLCRLERAVNDCTHLNSKIT